VARVGAEGDVRLRRDHARHLVEHAGDDVGELVVDADSDNRHQVVVAGDRVDLADRGDLRDCLGDLGDALDVGLDQDDGGDHELPPGALSWVRPVLGQAPYDIAASAAAAKHP
jgi:hypothetical protein